MTPCYLDASVALHAVLPDGDRRARAWFDRAAAADEIHASTLLRLELSRVVRRERLDVGRVRSVTDRVREISVGDGILQFAAAIEPHVKSLDAIHLATCLLLGSDVTLVTHDAQMAEVAGQLGLDVLDPLDPAVSR